MHGRPSKAKSFGASVEDLLARDPNLATGELLSLARRGGYVGGKSAFYALVARVRQGQDPEGSAALPGERSHHGIGEADVSLASGERLRARFFASRLAYSGWLAVSLIEDHGAEPVARALVDHFAAMGGVPFVARFEQPKPVAEVWTTRGELGRFSLAFAYLAAELGIGIEVRRPSGLARRVKEQFFASRVFRDGADISAKLAAWCQEVDLHTPSDAQAASGATPATLLAHERRRLRPLAVSPDKLELREPVFVGAGGAVVHGSHVYSMPLGAAGRMGVLLLGREHVRLVAGAFEAVHPRLVEPGARSVLPEHAFLVMNSGGVRNLSETR
jgi:hypothetical protein